MRRELHRNGQGGDQEERDDCNSRKDRENMIVGIRLLTGKLITIYSVKLV